MKFLSSPLTLMGVMTTVNAFSLGGRQSLRRLMATEVRAISAKSTDAYTCLSGVELFRTTDGLKVELVNEWSQDDVAVVTLFRSFG